VYLQVSQKAWSLYVENEEVEQQEPRLDKNDIDSCGWQLPSGRQ
jgi:hypothetical protein